MKIVYNKTQSISVSIGLLMSICFFSVSDFSRMLSHIGIPRSLPYLVFIVMFLLFIKKYIYKFRMLDSLYTLLVFPAMGYAIFINGQYIDSVTSIYATIILFAPSYYFFRFCPREDITSGFKVAMYFSSIYLLAFYVFYMYGSSEYNMDYAYWITFPLASMSYYFFQEKKIVQLLIIIALFYTQVISGCRGALGLTILCICIIYLFSGSTRKKRKRFVIFFMIISIVLLNTKKILGCLANYTGASRNIQKIIEGSFFDTSSRDQLYGICNDIIANNPLGCGILSSRKLIVGYPYPHSILLELQIDFGKILGFLILLFILYAAYKVFIYHMNQQMMIVVACITVIGLGALFVSSSLYQEYYVPAIIGMYITRFYEMRRNKNEKRIFNVNK